MYTNHHDNQARIDLICGGKIPDLEHAIDYEVLCELMDLVFAGALPLQVNPVEFLLELGFATLFRVLNGDYDEEELEEHEAANVLLARAGKLASAGKRGEAYNLLRGIHFRWASSHRGRTHLDRWEFDAEEYERLKAEVKPKWPKGFK